jgi:membrane-associated phospholipid phosphatase
LKVGAHVQWVRGFRVRWWAAAVLAIALLARRPARADEAAAQAPVEGGAGVTPAPAPATAQKPARKRVEWNPEWPKFRYWEYGGTVLLGGTSLYLRYYRKLPPEAKWQGDNAFDSALRSWLRADTRQGREQAGKVSDYLYWGGIVFPFAVDLPVVLFVHKSWTTTWQLLWMDLEANAVSGFITNAMFITAGRGRPSHADCAADPSYDSLCGATGNNASFPSGHTLGIATAAGLVCVHHHYLPIFGGGAGDIAACAVLSAATAGTAISRVVADRHYFTDGLLGAAIGFGAGYGLPWLLHYRYGTSPNAEAQRRAMLLPFGASGAVGVQLVGLM